MTNIILYNCKEFSTVDELCNLLLISKKTVYRMISQKKVKSLKIGGTYLIETSSLNSLIEEV